MDIRYYTQHQRGHAIRAQSRASAHARHHPARDEHTSHATLCGVKGSQPVSFIRTATGPSLLDRHATARFHQEYLSLTAGNFHIGPARDQDVDYTASHEEKGPRPKGRQAQRQPASRTRDGSWPNRQASREPLPRSARQGRPLRSQPALSPVPLSLGPCVLFLELSAWLHPGPQMASSSV